MPTPTHPYPDEIQRLIQAVLEGPGETAPAERQAVQALAAGLCLGQAQGSALAPGLAAYLAKVALAPFSVSEADIAALKAAGFSEEAIFELTIAAALGAGLARLDQMSALLEAGPDATGHLAQR